MQSPPPTAPTSGADHVLPRGGCHEVESGRRAHVTPSTSAPLAGAVLADRYALEAHLARGGMSDVYRATDRVLHRPVAVKVYRAGASQDRARFDAEVRVLAGLSHPNLVQVFDAGQHDGDGYVVLELIDGPTLRSVLEDRGQIPAHECARLGADVAGALAYIHGNGVVHRDVNLSNILCGLDGRPRLADFGIARLIDTTRITAPVDAVGTAPYMAPEQVRGEDVTPAADVYAFGLVLAELLTGHAVFTGPAHEAAMARLATDPDLTGILGSWRSLLEEMTAREPQQRPPASAVRERLATLVDGGEAALAVAVAGVGVAAPAPDPDAQTAAIAAATANDPMVQTAAITAVAASAAPAGGTSVMPAVLAADSGRSPAPASAGGRRGWWLAAAALALVLVLAAASSGDGLSLLDEATTSSSTVPVTTTETTVAPTTTVAPLPPPPPPEDGGKSDDKGRSDDKGKSDEGKDDD